MRFKLRLIPAASAACLVAACGGGASTTQAPTPTPTSGVAIDGYLVFSKVTCDANGNGIDDAGETAVYTTEKGNFVFPNGCTHSLIVSGGRSSDTNLLLIGALRAPAGAAFVTPLTTFLAAGLTQSQLNTALELPATTNLLTTDPAASVNGVLTNPSLMRKTLAVQQLLQKVSELAGGLAGDSSSGTLIPIYNTVAASFANSLKSSSPLNNADGTFNESVVTSLVKGALNDVITATSVPEKVRTALRALGATALADVSSKGLKIQADAILAAKDTSADVAAVTKDRQSNETIAQSIKTAVANGTLSSTTTAAAISQLALQIATVAAAPTATTPVEPTSPTTPTPGSEVLISFDESNSAFTDMGAYGGALPTVGSGPAGGSGNALKIVKPSGSEIWGGIYFTTAAIPFTATNKTVTARVYSSRAGSVIKFKAEAKDGSAVEIASAPTGAANTWQTVTWDFSAVDLSKSYVTVAITPDAETTTSGQSYYIDDISLIAGTSSTPKFTGISFDEATAAFTDMGAYGGAMPSVGAGPIGSNGNSLKIVKPSGTEIWGGIYFSTAALPFSLTNKSVSARVYASRAGAVIKLKVEATDKSFVEVASAPTGAANTWHTVVWDLSDVDLAKSYKTVAITPDAETNTTGHSYYIDDISLSATVTPSPTPVTDYLYLSDNALALFDGNKTTSYSMSQFQSFDGINVKWPMVNSAALKLSLAQNGNFNLAEGQTLSAAMQITETKEGGLGEIKGYIGNVSVSKSGTNVLVTVPRVADALLYGVSTDGKMKAVINFGSAVAGVTNTLSAASNMVNSIIFGEVVNYAVSGVSNDFTGMNSLRGKYRVKIVVTDLPLRKIDGSKFDVLTIEVPTTMSNGVPGTIRPVTGWGLDGYINLVD
jgi:hypothetical protein